MGQQVAKLEYRIVEIVAEHRLAKMLDKNAANRAAAIEHPAIVAGAGPEHVALLGIVDQSAKERRPQAVRVLAQWAAHQDDDRHIEPALADERYQRRGPTLQALAAPVDDD